MNRILGIGLSIIGFALVAGGGYETVKTFSTIQYYDLILSIKRRKGWDILPDGLILATIDTESSFDSEAVRTEYPIDSTEVYKDASIGLMQVLYTTARNLGFTGDIWDLQDPEIGLTWGMAYQVYLWKKYKDWDAVIHAYNEGETQYNKGVRVPVYYGKVKSRWVKYAALLSSGGDISG
jgi:soluble lytic murein transglycosylase-like protein